MAALAPPDDDVLPAVEYLTRLVAQLVLTHLRHRRTLAEYLECFKSDTGDAGIKRALPEFLNRVPASNHVAAGRQHLPICGVQRRQSSTVALGRGRRELCVGGLDGGPHPVGVRRLSQTSDERDDYRSTKRIKA